MYASTRVGPTCVLSQGLEQVCFEKHSKPERLQRLLQTWPLNYVLPPLLHCRRRCRDASVFGVGGVRAGCPLCQQPPGGARQRGVLFRG